MRWIKKMNDTSYDGHDELYHHAKFGEDRTTRAGCMGAKMGCFFVSHAESPEHHAFEGCINRTSIAMPFISRFRRGFQRFSQEMALSDALLSSHRR